MRMYIIRHGQTPWNAKKRLQGRSDIDLNEKGVRHPFLAAFAAWLALCCAKMHGFATASFFPGRFFSFLIYGGFLPALFAGRVQSPSGTLRTRS